MNLNATSPQQDGLQFVIAFILAIALMAADYYGQLMGSVRSALLTTLSPIEQAATFPKQVYDLVTTDFTSMDELKLENQKLKTEILLLKAKTQQLANMELEIQRLEGLLGTTGKMNDRKVQIATVNFFSSNPLSQFLTLNKGQLDEVKAGQVVIDEQGIMGQIIHTTPTTSRLLLITDPDHQIPVRIQRTGQRGILNGTGYDSLSLQFIPQNSSVEIGDLLESSGLGEIFPAGYPVARVTKINKQEEEPYLEIIATPVAQLRQAHKVLIISPYDAEKKP
ncbi:rod shape-determining protein MreC [Thiomicrorhabdus sp. zzn3]|uniref:rod shape-determining protein MreC n=1 Tax=Thiomicrorhabdus sp. zzn3 TaxID=3039775 RepID=UPI0024372B64|nr:rod shape-determining protein MreC [Thiomicrorhabdus sp. zzn3]MDG6777503.1 rod shape-determining protein MreC [Thiomicrorhabdus sp. zzn3]